MRNQAGRGCCEERAIPCFAVQPLLNMCKKRDAMICGPCGTQQPNWTKGVVCGPRPCSGAEARAAGQGAGKPLRPSCRAVPGCHRGVPRRGAAQGCHWGSVCAGRAAPFQQWRAVQGHPGPGRAPGLFERVPPDRRAARAGVASPSPSLAPGRPANGQAHCKWIEKHVFTPHL